MNVLLFITTALIWGSTWLGIQYQLGGVSLFWSLAYRFGGAAIILFIYCLATGRSLRLAPKQHGWIALQSLFMFTLCYVLFYSVSSYFVSGIVAILFASIIFWNIINSAVFLKNPMILKTIVGALCGLMGLVCIMWAEILRLENCDFWYLMKGLMLGGIAAACASLGQTASVANARRGIPLIQINAYGYAYATLFLSLYALAIGQPPTFDLSAPYVLSLLYLTVFGTVIAFLSYLTLISRIGSDKGAYVFIFTPLIALSLSSLYEDFSMSGMTVLGLVLVVVGNILVMAKRPQSISFFKLSRLRGDGARIESEDRAA